jgi:hypothetical protein
LSGCSNLYYPYKSATPTTITGNWLFNGLYAQSSVLYAPYNIGGSITNTSGQLSGVLHIQQPCFANGATDVPFTGSLNSSHQLQITSLPVNGQTLTLAGNISDSGNSLSGGTFSVVGGCSGDIVGLTGPNGPGATFNLTGLEIPSLTDSWATTNQVSGPNLSEQLTQSSTADAHGDFALSGTVSVQGSPCFTTGTIQSGSYISGDIGKEIILFNDGSTLSSPITHFFQNLVSKPIIQLYPGTITGGNCNGPIDIVLQ